MSLPRKEKISAVVACYRDGPAVPHMYTRLKAAIEQAGATPEIIFVNDASPDDAEQVLTELASQDPSVVVVNHARNFGSQAAFTSGMKLATGDAVVLLDGDLQDPPELIPSSWLAGERPRRRLRDPVKRGRRSSQVAYKVFYCSSSG